MEQQQGSGGSDRKFAAAAREMTAAAVCTLAGLAAIAPAAAQTGGVSAGSLLQQQQPQRGEDSTPRPTGRDVLPPPVVAPEPPTTAAQQRRLTVRAFRLVGNKLIANEVLQEELQPWVNKPVTLGELRGAARRLQDVYRAQGRLTVVSIPPQDISDGVVTLNIVEANVGEVAVRQVPGAADDAAVAGRSITAAEARRVREVMDSVAPRGAPVDLADMQRGLLIADELPGVLVNGSLRASTTRGATDLLVDAAPERRWAFDGSLDNSGSRAVGAIRATGQATANSVLGYGEQFQLLASATQGSQYVRAGGSAPIWWSGWSGWRAGVTATALRYQVLDKRNNTTGDAPRGNSQTLGGELQYPLVRTPTESVNVMFGAEQRWLRNEDDVAQVGRFDTTSRAKVRVFSVGASGTRIDTYQGGGTTSGGIRLGLGRLDLAGSAPQLLANDLGVTATEGSYRKLVAHGQRNQKLPWHSYLVATVSGQLADRNLDPSEKIYLGGPTGVRAYPVGEAGGSSGLLASLELRRPLAEQLTVGLFYDWGRVNQFEDNHRADNGAPLVADNSVQLQGYGLNVAYRPLSNVELKATWARRIGTNPLATANGNDTDGSLDKNRIWLNARVTF